MVQTEKPLIMNSIHLLNKLLFKLRKPLPDEVWLELLETGVRNDEIQHHFGITDGIDSRVRRLTQTQRRQMAFYSTRFSTRMALWWVLVQTHHQTSQRRAFAQAFAYPLLLLGLAFGMMGLLNHVMLPRINGFFSLSEDLNQSTGWIVWLNILEIIYIGGMVMMTLVVLVPPQRRVQMLLHCYHFPMLSGLRLLVSHRFMSLLILILAKGVSIHDLLFVLSNGNDPLLCQLMREVDHDLQRGKPLNEALMRLDARLGYVFLFQDGDHPLENHLKRYHSIQTLRVQSLVKSFRGTAMGMAYLSFGIIIVSAYQLMFEPIRRLEQLL